MKASGANTTIMKTRTTWWVATKAASAPMAMAIRLISARPPGEKASISGTADNPVSWARPTAKAMVADSSTTVPPAAAAAVRSNSPAVTPAKRQPIAVPITTWAAATSSNGVSRQELLALLGRRTPGKVLTVAEAVSVAAMLRAEGRRLVFTNGCFDILHRGHTEYLARARSYGDALLVAVNDDESVRRLQKARGRPVNPVAERMAVLAALQAVDYVLPFAKDDPSDLVVKLTPQILVKGEDWREQGVVW